MTLAFTSIGPQIALVVFLTLFLGVILWLWLTPRRRWEHDARIPLDDAPQRSDPTSSAAARGAAPSDRNRSHG